MEYMDRLKKYPLLAKVGLVVIVIAFVAGMIEIFIDPNPLNDEEDTSTSSGYYDYFDRM